MTHALTQQIARALGLPKHTARAVLTLDAMQPPRIDLTMHVTDSAGRIVIEEAPAGENIAKRIAQVRFMVRLEPFPEIRK